MNTGKDDHYVISLTTYYPRFAYAHKAIESVLAQKCSYRYSVHLYLARADIIKNNNVIPPEIEKLTEKGLKIFIVEEDLLVYNKYVHALKNHPGETIVTVDDDIVYPCDFLDKLIEKSRRFPNCIVCFRGHFLSFDENGKLLPYNLTVNRRLDNRKRGLPSYCLLPTGVSGVLYPPDSLHETALDHKLFRELSPYNDDIWLKIASLLNDAQCVQVENHNVHFPTVSEAQATSLSETNITNCENDRQLEACFSRYPELLEKVGADDKRLSAICKIPDAEVFLDNCLMAIKRRILDKPRALMLLRRLKAGLQSAKSVSADFLQKRFSGIKNRRKKNDRL